MWNHSYCVFILMLLVALGGSNAQLIKALGTLLMPALDFIKPKVPLFGPSPALGPNSNQNNGPNGQNGFGSRNTICRNTVEGHTVCGFGSPGGNRFDEGTLKPLATGFDEILPSNCGRNIKDGTGKLCFPDGILCQRRK